MKRQFKAFIFYKVCYSGEMNDLLESMYFIIKSHPTTKKFCENRL